MSDDVTGPALSRLESARSVDQHRAEYQASLAGYREALSSPDLGAGHGGLQDPFDEALAAAGRLDAAVAYHQGFYDRPKGWWTSIVNRPMPPLPTDLRKIEPTQADYEAAKSYWPLAVLTLVGMLGWLVVATTFLPSLLTRNLLVQGGAAIAGDRGASIATAIVVNLALILLLAGLVIARRNGSTGTFLLFKLALEEELWFRAGAESWTVRQRIVSCALFGAAHLANLAIAVVTLGGLAAVGAIFMLVYLRTLRHSRSQRLALITAAKFHAHYNVTAFTVMVAIGVLYDVILLIGALGP